MSIDYCVYLPLFPHFLHHIFIYGKLFFESSDIRVALSHANNLQQRPSDFRLDLTKALSASQPINAEILPKEDAKLVR